jgi:hypothetical protein
VGEGLACEPLLLRSRACGRTECVNIDVNAQNNGNLTIDGIVLRLIYISCIVRPVR